MADTPTPGNPDDPRPPSRMPDDVPAVDPGRKPGRQPYPVNDPGIADPDGPGSEPDYLPGNTTGPTTTM
jgi:hypothetical protein